MRIHTFTVKIDGGAKQTEVAASKTMSGAMTIIKQRYDGQSVLFLTCTMANKIKIDPQL